MEHNGVINLNDPSPFSAEIIEHLLTQARTADHPKATLFHFVKKGERMCYIILSGSVSVIRNSDKRVLVNISAPLILGLNIFGEDTIHIKLLSECQVGELPLETAMEIIRTRNLWEQMTYYMMSFSKKIWISSEMLSAGSSYDLIKYQLTELMKEPEDYRNNISADLYIKNKTNLSRSGIMRILAELKKGGYIVMLRGILLKINQLPPKF
ncbi:winged helix-turn-helix transcriptional regulator [Enterobacter sp. CC120223-11]|uniref:winged helix-turn-helix transcriptional regulator n=1 Tax=Enterobacter sp. CC120223-11 TaxID=1378073 RepID=UPI000BE337EB|nr:winged helix-turn-helix transcriptional regulator [Enterobacter sp. CC120223-11]